MVKGQHSTSIDYLFLAVSVFLVAGYFVWQTGHLGGQSWDYDEGVWAMEARLLAQGYPLYKEIYAPAPPLFIFSLATGFELFGESIETARLVALLFASLGLFAIGLIGYNFFGRIAGIMAILLLATAPDFYLYSRVPNGDQASLGILMWGILFGLYYYNSGKRYWLYLAGVMATIGLYFKFLPLFLLPVLGTLVGLRHFGNSQECFINRSKNLLVDSGQAAVPFIVVTLICLAIFDTTEFVDQVFLHHLNGQIIETPPPQFLFQSLDPISARIVEAFVAYGALEWPPNILANIAYFLINHRGLTLLAILGLFPLYQQKKDYFIVACVWLIITGGMAFLYRPMFQHLYTIYLYPLAVLAGVSVARLVELIANLKFKESPVTIFEMSLYLVGVGIYLYGVPSITSYIQDKNYAPEDMLISEAIAIIQESTDEQDWVIADIQAVAFLAGRNVPPPMAETSTMRLMIHDLTLDEVKQWTTEYSPKIVVTGRTLRRIPGYNEWLAQSYSIIFGDDERRFFVYRRNE